MLIFDRFADRRSAEAFASYCRQQFGREAQIFDSQDESNRVDVFPCRLDPPIVLVERDKKGGPRLEATIEEEEVVARFGGEFAGT